MLFRRVFIHRAPAVCHVSSFVRAIQTSGAFSSNATNSHVVVVKKI